MSIEDKILACYGNLTAPSTARVVGVHYAYVMYIYNKYNLKSVKPYAYRTRKGFYS